MTDSLDLAASVLASATSLVVGAGAGMGVDSGLPDFRGQEGFWRAYPPLERLGLRFEECANPMFFAREPRLAWGFYAHRLLLYRDTTPHEGFQAILEIARRLALPCFAVTSNVDAQFQKAGFDADRVYEVHGSIHYLQCAGPCSGAIWKNDLSFAIDEESLEIRDTLPACPRCGQLARPNILMFGDFAWVPGRSEKQHARYREFLRSQAGELPVYLEIGAGTAVPTIRFEGTRCARLGGRIVRANPRASEIEAPHVGVSLGAREALLGIVERFRGCSPGPAGDGSDS